MELKTSFEYELRQAFEYADNGTTKQAKSIVIAAPRGKIRCYTSQLKELIKDTSNVDFSKLPPQNTTTTQSKNDDTMDTPNKVIQNLCLLKNLAAASDVLRKILIEGSGVDANCKVDGLVKLTNPLYDMIGDEDLDEILGLYYINFFSTSLQI